MTRIVDGLIAGAWQNGGRTWSTGVLVGPQSAALGEPQSMALTGRREWMRRGLGGLKPQNC